MLLFLFPFLKWILVDLYYIYFFYVNTEGFNQSHLPSNISSKPRLIIDLTNDENIENTNNANYVKGTSRKRRNRPKSNKNNKTNTNKKVKDNKKTESNTPTPSLTLTSASVSELSIKSESNKPPSPKKSTTTKRRRPTRQKLNISNQTQSQPINRMNAQKRKNQQNCALTVRQQNQRRQQNTIDISQVSNDRTRYQVFLLFSTICV